MSCNTYLKRLPPKSTVIIQRESVMLGTVLDSPDGIQVHLNAETKYDHNGSEASYDFRKDKTDSKVSDEIKVSSDNNDESVEIARNNKSGLNRKYHTPSS